MAIRYSKDPQVDRTLRHSVRDGMAYSVMSGGGETYFSAFALFLKATTPQIGLLATLPPLLGSLAQLLAVWLGARMLHRLPVILAGATLQAFVLLPLLILPLVYRDQAIHILVVCVTLYYAGANLATPLWISLMGELVPERKRGRFFGRRAGVRRRYVRGLAVAHTAPHADPARLPHRLGKRAPGCLCRHLPVAHTCSLDLRAATRRSAQTAWLDVAAPTRIPGDPLQRVFRPAL